MITKEQVIETQNLWGAGVVKIGSLMTNRAECEAYTSSFLDDRYAFQTGDVLFKPTKCEFEQFRPTKEKAQSYFIAGDDRACEEDGGFAINPWTKVRFENTGFISMSLSYYLFISITTLKNRYIKVHAVMPFIASPKLITFI